ncbi:MAG: hypothetical protein WA584_14330 [Pyrinomonadaceae bacterium]
MRISRAGILILISISVLIGTNCAYYNRIIARKNLVDGAKAYKDKKFKDAEMLFRDAVGRDPQGQTDEGKTAQLFLARTIHSQYVGNRSPSLAESDVKDLRSLSSKLTAKSDAVSQFLGGQLTPETQQLATQFASNDQKRKEYLTALTNDLNKVINGPSIYDAGRFSQAKLSDFTKKYIADNPNPTGDAAARLNRLLIEESYPDELEKKPKAEDAIDAYKKVLAEKVDDNSSFKAVANLYETLGKQDEWEKWVVERTTNEKVPPEQRAEALTSLAARKYSCANEISDTPEVKKEITKGTERVYEFKKPADPAAFEKLKQCTNEGLDLINKALELEKKANVETDSTWSYKANLTVQKMRVAEMEGNTQEKDALKKEAETAKEKFTTLAAERKRLEDKKEEERKAKEEAANKK